MSARVDPMFDRRGRETEAGLWTSVSPGGAVSTAHYLATRAGNAALEAGGNAIDAAVAASLALAVCEPASSGLGGMAMMVVHLAESARTFSIESPCLAPAAATPAAVASSPRYRGYRAIAVPGHVAALEHALGRYGTMAPDAVCAEAIRLAEEGVPTTLLQHELAVDSLAALRCHGGGALFLDSGEPRPVGQKVRQPQLAATLRRLASHGFREFYEGNIARQISADILAHGGFVAESDLKKVAAREATPLAAPFGGGTAHVLGPPGGGLALAQLLNILDTLDDPPSLDSSDGVAFTAKLIRAVRRERVDSRLIVDMDGVGTAEHTLSRQWARDVIAEARHPVRADPSAGETSHLSVMDRHGNAVALTQSVERSFGSAEATGELGFLYNGYMRGFKVQNQRHPHFLRPGVAARSNAAPTIVNRGGVPWICIGSTGSERLVSGIFTTLMRLSTGDPFAAVQAPRLHATPRSEVVWEADRFPRGTADDLRRAGFSLRDLPDYSFVCGGLHLTVRDGDHFVAVADPRRDGAAAGPVA